MRNAHLSTTALLATLCLAGCGSEPAEQASSAPLSAADKVEAIASTLQACSYEGEPVKAQPAALTGAAPGDCSMAVNRIMGYTGLPANFIVASGPVPNAAAVILLDEQRIPKRVIAFNPDFMAEASRRVGGNPWGPISVMAHEIAHHLSGHTITPGGSRPEIELEADKFSGFVLNKMGAPLAAASQMILAVGSDHASPTHPAKQQRADAIRDGWMQSCQQAGGRDCASGTVVAPPAPTAQAPAMQPAPAPIPANITRVTLPAPGTTPLKFGRFVVDETGKLDPARAKAIETQLYALAKDSGAEFAILVVDDLKGMSAKDYAWAMMRQLRIGKLDVGNGAVAVVAPKQRQAAVAFGPGFAKEAEFSKPDQQLVQWIDAAWRYCDDADGCAGWTDNLFNVFRLTLSNVRSTQWTIRYQSLGELLDHYAKVNAERLQTKRAFDPKTDQPLGNLIRVNGTITSLSAPTGFGQANERLLGGELGYTAVSLKTDDGYPVILYVSPQQAGLMPSGKLKEGARYTLVGRLQKTGDKAKQASALWLFSYDQL
jgi:hypothetical protein